MEPEATTLQDDATAITTESPEENISLGDFAAKVSGEPAVAVEPESSEPEPERHRPRKQRARAGDVPRIAELTRRLRETEAERDALKGGAAPAPAAAVPKVVEAGTTVAPAPVTRAAAPVPLVKSAEGDPEPDSNKYDDLTNWMRDHSRWSAREELRAAHAEQEQATKAEQQRTETTRLEAQWKTETTAAKVKYPDFEQVAYAPTQIPKGSLVDAWILEHKAGPLVLYHLQKTPQELHAMLAMPLLDQVEALTLLSQRLSGSRTAAVVTGAAPALIAQPVSRPPTPVRTGPMRTSDEPPDPDAISLGEHTKYYGTPRSRRARE